MVVEKNFVKILIVNIGMITYLTLNIGNNGKATFKSLKRKKNSMENTTPYTTIYYEKPII